MNKIDLIANNREKGLNNNLNNISNTVRREKYIFNIYLSLLFRDFKKYKNKIIYFLGFLYQAPSMKPSYFFCRAIDDFADGDKALPTEINSFEELLNKLYSTIDNPNNNLSDIELVLIDAIKKLEQVSKPGDNIRKDFKNFLKSMLDEYQRRISFKLYSKENLNKIYDDSFNHVINIALIGVQSHNRVQDLGDFGRLQGKIKAIKDLKHEIPLGIINIPKEVINKSSLNLEDIIKTPEIIFNNNVIVSWINSELQEGKKMISKLRTLKLDNRAKIILNFSINSLEKFIEKGLTKANNTI